MPEKSRGTAGSFWENTSKMAEYHLELHRLMIAFEGEWEADVVYESRMIFYQ